MSSSASGGDTAARNGLRAGPGIETATGASNRDWVPALPILESETDEAPGVGVVVSDVGGDAAEEMADVAAAGAVARTVVDDEAGDRGMEPNPALAVTGWVWTGLGADGRATDEPGAEKRAASVLASVRLLVRSASVMC